MPPIRALTKRGRANQTRVLAHRLTLKNLSQELSRGTPSPDALIFRHMSTMTETDARRFFEEARWPSERSCVHCEHGKTFLLDGKSHRPGLYKCSRCRGQFTVTVGTVFHRMKLPFRKVMMGIFCLFFSSRKVSTRQLAYILKVPYATAWKFVGVIGMVFGFKVALKAAVPNESFGEIISRILRYRVFPSKRTNDIREKSIFFKRCGIHDGQWCVVGKCVRLI